MHRPNEPSLGSRIPSLDGLRALSILFVCLGHVSGTPGFPPTPVQFWVLGHLGVRVFFVISGFLITGLLLRDIERRGRIALGRFYIRRTLRIFPPYYVFLAAMTLATAHGWITLHPGDLARAFTYTTVYATGVAWPVAHTWSLSVEEQFYLAWPGILCLVGMSRGLWVALGFVVGISILQFAADYLQLVPTAPAHNVLLFQTVAVGCLLALRRDWLWQQRPYRALLSSPWMVLIPAAVLLVEFVNPEGLEAPRFTRVVGRAAIDVAIAISLDWCVRNPSSPLGRMLNWRPLVWIGVMSYSIYLWQSPFLNRTAPSTFTSFPLNVVLVAVAALTSYYIVERPALRLRTRLERWLDARGQAKASAGALSAPHLPRLGWRRFVGPPGSSGEG